MTLRRTLAALLLGSSLASGYYHFVRFAGRNAPFNAIVEKFDVNALTDKTVTFQIADNGPANLASGDSLAAFVSQLRSAARVWSEVETSELRIRFGGFFNPAQPTPVTPGIDVVFEDLPPGVNGYGSVTVRGDFFPGSTFVPIQRSQVVLNRDLASRPSWSEQFFLTAVHEFGHALGLQHSFASGAMATEITRGTTKIRPITPDDAAGISVLYPTPTFRQLLGTITGRVTTGNDGVAMASVVAIAPRGAAVSALTNPDGTFKIEGLPPGEYYIYAHPLPAALQGEPTPGNINPPLDDRGRPFDFGVNFDTLFFPASRSPFVTRTVVAGASSDGVNFAVARRSTPGIHSVQTFSFPAQTAVKPAQLYFSGGPRNFMAAAGVGLVQNSQPAAGLQISALGGFATVPNGAIRPYPSAPASYIEVTFQFGQFPQEGPGHLIFSRGNDLYVLPNALRLADRSAPTIESVTVRPDGASVLVSGQNLAADTRISFDGAVGTTRGLDEQGRLIATLPPAANAYRSSVVAFNSDGQSSLFVQAPFAFIYENFFDANRSAVLTFSPAILPAGTESLVDITTTEPAGFVDGAVLAGFNTSDIQVRRSWVAAGNRIMANVWVSPAAAGSSATVTVSNGLRLLTQSGVLQIGATPARPLQANLPFGVNGLVPGTPAQLQLNSANLGGAITVTLNGQAAAVTSVENSVVTFNVPNNLPVGPIAVRVNVAGEVGLPIGMQVLPPPALITSVVAGFNQVISEVRPARPGEILTVLVSGLPENLTNAAATPKITITVNGVEHRIISINPLGGALQFQFILQGTLPSGSLPVAVSVDGISTTLFNLPVRTQN